MSSDGRPPESPAAGRSVWQAIAPMYVPNPRLIGERTPDVVVVGGGFSGLSAAWHIKQIDPAASVVLIEAREVGAGGSGRAAGNCFGLFGESLGAVRLLYGRERTVEALRYVRKALRYLAHLVESQKMDSDYEPRAFWRVSTSERLTRRLQATHHAYEQLGLGDGFEWIPPPRVGASFPSSPFHEALAENDCALLDPLKHVREWKRLCEEAGVAIFESTPLVGFESGRKLTIRTPAGVLRADRLVLGTDADSHRLAGLPELRGRQSVLWTHMIATEPLRREQRDAIGWAGGEGLYDGLQQLHYFRLTRDGRLCFGGGTPAVTTARELSHRSSHGIWSALERRLVHYFPPLAGIRVEHRWKGPISVCADMAPAMGFLRGERVLYSCGFVGHGIPITQLNGKTAAQMICGRSSDLTAFWGANRRVLPWLPHPLDYVLKRAVLTAMRARDLWDQAA